MKSDSVNLNKIPNHPNDTGDIKTKRAIVITVSHFIYSRIPTELGTGR